MPGALDREKDTQQVAAVAKKAALLAEHKEIIAALVAKEDGYRCYSRIADDAKGVLAPGGRMLLECGHQQAAEVENRLSEAGWAEIRRHRDLGSIERVVSASLDGD